MKKFVLRFDGPPGFEAGRFIEAEIDGVSVNAGEWKQEGNDWLIELDWRVCFPEVAKAIDAAQDVVEKIDIQEGCPIDRLDDALLQIGLGDSGVGTN